MSQVLRRTAITLGILVVLLALLVVFGGGWCYSDQLLPAPAYEPEIPDVDALFAGGQVTLPAGPNTCLERIGVRVTGEVYLQLDQPVADCPDGGAVTRPFTAVIGTPTEGAGQQIATDAYYWPGDPATAGLEFEDVSVPGPIGALPSWHLPGEDPTWVVAVHGRGGGRGEGLRLAAIVSPLGHPVLIPSIRGDGVAPAPDEGVGRFGAAEWEDVEAAVAWARERGAADVVLAGFSQGGSAVAFFLERSAQAEGVAGAILDAPLLDLPATLTLQAQERDIPDALIPPILLGTGIVARLRAGVSVAAVDHVARAGELGVPILLFHGEEDDSVPLGSSERLADALPEAVTFVLVADAGHVRSWNADPEGYAAAVTAFLEGLAA